MEIVIRDWTREDVADAAALWLGALDERGHSDLGLHADAEHRLRVWLRERVRDRGSLGLVAEADHQWAGFVLGRVGEWVSSPPILRSRPIGLIDVVCVVSRFRRQGVASQLVGQAIARMEARGASLVETSFEVSDPAARSLWARMGFHTTLERARRSLGEGRD